MIPALDLAAKSIGLATALYLVGVLACATVIASPVLLLVVIAERVISRAEDRS